MAISGGSPGRTSGWHSGGASTATTRRPAPGALSPGIPTSSLIPASAVVLPNLTSAELLAVVTTPVATLVGRAWPRGLPSGRTPASRNRSKYRSG